METIRVLVVDDEPGVRHAIRRVLERHTCVLPGVDAEARFEVTQADSGRAGLEAMEAGRCDVALLDHRMDGMTGQDVLESIRGRGLDLVVVMVTAFATIDNAVRATRSGAFDFVTKPFTPEDIRVAVEKASGHLLALRRARDAEAARRRTRFEFIRVLGHELKAPLAAVESYLNLMASRSMGDDIGAYDDMIERCRARAEGMRKLIGDLLDLTRIESGQKRREITAFDLVSVIETAIESVRTEAETRAIAISFDAPRPLEMTGDRGELEIIANNLLTNAVKYNRDGGSVRVSLTPDERRVVIAVEDTGIGMKPDEADRLFNDFVRIKNHETRHILGSGLGLSIVKRIAGLYNGRVSVLSEPGAGSTFTVELDRRPDPETGPAAQAAPAALSSPEGGRDA